MHQETFALNCSRTSLAMDGTLVVVVEMSLSTWLVCAEVPGLERHVMHSTSIPVKRVQRHRLWVQRHCSATSKDQRHRSATLKLEATSQSANHPSQHNKNLIYELRKAPSKPSSSFGASMSRNFTSTVALQAMVRETGPSPGED